MTWNVLSEHRIRISNRVRMSANSNRPTKCSMIKDLRKKRLWERVILVFTLHYGGYKSGGFREDDRLFLLLKASDSRIYSLLRSTGDNSL